MGGGFIRNAWYVCAWSREVGREPLQRWICGEPLVLWRRGDGRIAALADRCPHRAAPLSRGRLVGDDIQCGYHGLVFDSGGACVSVPGASETLKGAGTRAYPVVERWGWAFAWLGASDKADPGLVPDFHWLGDPSWAGKGETLPVKASHALLRDNLLDLSHARFVHQRTLATDAVVEFPIETDFDGERLTVLRDMRDIVPSPFFARLGGFEGRVNHRQHVTFTPPGNIVIRLRVASAAAPDDVVEMRVLNALTPETEGTSLYFWSLLRDSDLGNEDLTEWMFRANASTFDEDVAVIEPQQEMMERAPPPARPVRWGVDKGVTLAQRWVDRLLAEEAAAG